MKKRLMDQLASADELLEGLNAAGELDAQVDGLVRLHHKLDHRRSRVSLRPWPKYFRRFPTAESKTSHRIAAYLAAGR